MNTSSPFKMRRTLVCILLLPALAGCPRRHAENAGGSQAGGGTGPGLSLPSIVARPAFAYAGNGPKLVSLSDVAERAVKSVVNISSTRKVTREPGASPFHGNPFFDQLLPRPATAGAGAQPRLGRHRQPRRPRRSPTTTWCRAPTRSGCALYDGRELGGQGGRHRSRRATWRCSGCKASRELQPLPLRRTPSRLRLGDVVLAIGNPFGVGQTVTMGIVSAKGRANMGIVDYEDFIQTDAAINPGNSGGALVNMQGELVGINTAILSRTGGYQGIGFAIPSNMARPIMESLLKNGRVVRGWLGVAIQDLNEEMARALKLPVSRGRADHRREPDGPAAKAGLRREDVITHVNGRAVDTRAHLRNQVATAGAGASVKLRVLRGGAAARAHGQARPPRPRSARAKLDRNQGALGGLTVEPLGDELTPAAGAAGAGRAAWWSRPSTRAAQPQSAGLQVGDVILEINRQPVANPTAVRRALPARRGARCCCWWCARAAPCTCCWRSDSDRASPFNRQQETGNWQQEVIIAGCRSPVACLALLL